MRNPRIRHVGVIGLVAMAMVAAVGCDLVKVGAKCRAGAAPGRDSTHLVVCKNGRWTKTITLQETANILVGLLPAKAEVVSGSDQTTEVNQAFAKDFQIKVTRGDGNPAVGTDVDLTVPATGPALDRGPRTVKTNDNGIATFLATANSVIGSYEVTAKVRDRDVSTTLKFTNTAGAAKSVTLASGGAQSAVANTDFATPIGLKVTDAFGNPVKGAVPTVTSPDVMLAGQPSSGMFSTPAPTGADGLTSFTVKAPARSGVISFTAVATAATASSGVTFSLNVKPDVPVQVVLDPATPQSADVGDAFPALAVTVLDQFENPIPGLTVTYTVAENGGADATLSAPTAMTNSSGVASVIATARGTTGAAYTVQVAVQNYAPQSSIEFDLINT